MLYKYTSAVNINHGILTAFEEMELHRTFDSNIFLQIEEGFAIA